MSMHAENLSVGPAIDDRELSQAEAVEQADRLAVQLGIPSFDAVIQALDAGRLRVGPDELRARMLRHLLDR